jgi:5'-deoxynucleotidase
VEERKAGNLEFSSAELASRQKLEALNLPEVDWFLANLMPGFEKNLDELGTFE